MVYRAVGANTNFPHTKCGPHKKELLPKFVYTFDTVMDKQSTCFICIIYPGKHNGTVFLTYGACTEQLEWKEIFYQAITVFLSTPKVNKLLVAIANGITTWKIALWEIALLVLS